MPSSVCSTSSSNRRPAPGRSSNLTTSPYMGPNLATLIPATIGVVLQSAGALARADRYREPVLRRSQRTGIKRVVDAGRVGGPVEVDDHLAGSRSDLQAAGVGVLDGVEEIAAAAIRLLSRGRVPEGREEPAAVADDREHGEPAVLVQHAKPQRADPPVADHAVFSPGVDLEQLAVARLDPGGHPVGGIGLEPAKPREAGPLPDGYGRLRMLPEQLASSRAPGLERGRSVGVADPAAPIHEVEMVLDCHGPKYRAGGHR